MQHSRPRFLTCRDIVGIDSRLLPPLLLLLLNDDRHTYTHYCNLREGNWIYPGRIKPPPRAAFNPSAGGQQYIVQCSSHTMHAHVYGTTTAAARLNRCVLKTSVTWRAQGPPGNLANDILITRPRWYLYNIHHHYYHHHFGDKYSRFHRVYLST